MTANLKRQIESIFRQAVEAVVPAKLLPQVLDRTGDGKLRIRAELVNIPDEGVYLIAIGKAAVPMAFAAEEILGDAFRDGICVTKAVPPDVRPRSRIHFGSHPVPDQRSIEAGGAVLDFTRRVPNNALVVCLISGGGSSLVEAPVDGVSLEDVQRVTGELLRAGASIDELNAVRTRMSRIKGGGLLDALKNRRVWNLVISDVLGDDPAVIASGPTTPPAGGVDPDQILERFGIEYPLPGEHGQIQSAPPTFIIANLSTAIDAAAGRAAEIGYTPVILSRSVQGEAREAGRFFASIAVDSARSRTAFGPGSCLIAGGETTVTVTGDGAGGRNTEAALSAALTLRCHRGVAAGFLASDGDDGTTGVAGAVVDGATIRPDRVSEAERALHNNDSYTLLESVGATVRTGPTGVNVNDLMIAIIEGFDS